MGRARVVAPPPQDYEPEPLVVPPIEEVSIAVAENQWEEGSLIEEEIPSPDLEELERERIAQAKYEQLLIQKAEQEAKSNQIRERLEQEYSQKLEKLKSENEKLVREKADAEKIKEEQILRMRQEATQRGATQLNLIQVRKPTLRSRIKEFFKRKRIDVATMPKIDYEKAIIMQAQSAVPKMLDDIEKMHERLVILEELLAKYKERQNNKN